MKIFTLDFCDRLKSKLYPKFPIRLHILNVQIYLQSLHTPALTKFLQRFSTSQSVSQLRRLETTDRIALRGF